MKNSSLEKEHYILDLVINTETLLRRLSEIDPSTSFSVALGLIETEHNRLRDQLRSDSAQATVVAVRGAPLFD